MTKIQRPSFSVSVSVIQQEYPQKVEPKYCKPTVEEKLEYAIDCMTANVDREKAWSFIRSLNDTLMEKPSVNNREKALLLRMKPLIEKFGSSAGATVDYNKWIV